MELSYNKLWSGFWGDIQRFGPVHRHIAEQLIELVSSLDVHSVMDVGCGSGDNLAAIAALNRYDLTGVDISSEAIGYAGLRVPSAKLYCLDIEHDLLPQKFDLVISIQVVEHLLDDLRAFKSIASMASRYVFISTLSGTMRPSEVT